MQNFGKRARARVAEGVLAPTVPATSPRATHRTHTQGDYRVADISLADFGRREIELAERAPARAFRNRRGAIDARRGAAPPARAP